MSEKAPVKSTSEIVVGLAQSANLLPRLCPSCSEKVKPMAIKCPHCHDELPSLNCDQMIRAREVSAVVLLVITAAFLGFVVIS